MLNLISATLLDNYNRKLEDGSNPLDLDIDDKFRITLQKVKPLQIMFPSQVSLLWSS